MYETLDVTVKDRVATVMLNRPKALNAINLDMMKELRQVAVELDEREDVCVVVLRGTGRAFCAGMDLKWSESLTNKDRVESNRLGQRTFDALENMSLPVVAVVHGYCLGGGLELALAADFMVCASNSKIGLPEITLSARPPYRPKATEDGDPDQPEVGGVVPGWGSMRRLPERIGKARAKQMILTGEHFTAERAREFGLVNEVYGEEEFEDKVASLAERLAAMNRYNLRLAKEALTKGYDVLEGHPV